MNRLALSSTTLQCSSPSPMVTFCIFLSDPSPIIGYACHSLTDWLTHWLTNSLLFRLMWAWHVKMATQNLLKFTRQRIVYKYKFLKLWRAFLDWNHIVKPFYLLKFTRQRIAYSFLKLWRAFLDWNHIVKPFYLLNILFRFCMYNELNFPFYRTRVRSLGRLVSNSLTDSLTDWLTAV